MAVTASLCTAYFESSDGSGAEADGSDSGSCGEGVIYTFDPATGTLTLSGTGEMKSYSSVIHAPWYSYRNDVQTLSLGSGITSIGNYAFYDFDSIVSVTIPDSVTVIGEFAFSDCASLTSVDIGSGVKTIGDSAFSDCTALASLVIPDNVETIERGAFYDCISLLSVTVGRGITSIGDYAFLMDSCLFEVINLNEDITVTAGSPEISIKVTDSDGTASVSTSKACLGAHAKIVKTETGESSVKTTDDGFIYGISEETVTGSDGAETTVEVCTLIRYTGTATDLTIPDTLGGLSVTRIGDGAFLECDSLVSVVIPDSVTSIGTRAFSGCFSLKSIIIPNGVTCIEYGTFSHCLSLVSVVIPDSVTSIGDGTFSECESLASVTLPNSIDYIGEEAFSYCSSLVSIVIPDSVTAIREASFSTAARSHP
ncbi:MAG: leucine-rich repeat domain-containing protein [Methanomethylophilus sp.]|nr:leucine-rich repeat domain-containing protein [Methanomethylophilus sp.]